MFKHLLLPTDGSALSNSAIEKGIQIARDLRARVTGIYVAPEFHVMTYRAEMLEDTPVPVCRRLSRSRQPIS